MTDPITSMPINPMKMNPDVLKYGRGLGIFEGTKEEAESYCAAQTEATGCLHDWHFMAGRKCLVAIPKEVTELLKDRALFAEQVDHLMRQKGKLQTALAIMEGERDEAIAQGSHNLDLREADGRLYVALRERIAGLEGALRQAIGQLEDDYASTPLDGHAALIRKLKAIAGGEAGK